MKYHNDLEFMYLCLNSIAITQKDERLFKLRLFEFLQKQLYDSLMKSLYKLSFLQKQK